MDDRIPETQPAGALVPPPRHPPTAVATAAPLPPRLPRITHARRATPWPLAILGGIVAGVLVGLDAVGDGVARSLGLRER